MRQWQRLLRQLQSFGWLRQGEEDDTFASMALQDIEPPGVNVLVCVAVRCQADVVSMPRPCPKPRQGAIDHAGFLHKNILELLGGVHQTILRRPQALAPIHPNDVEIQTREPFQERANKGVAHRNRDGLPFSTHVKEPVEPCMLDSTRTSSKGKVSGIRMSIF